MLVERFNNFQIMSDIISGSLFKFDDFLKAYSFNQHMDITNVL